MAKAIVESRGLHLVALKPEHIRPFIDNMSNENLREFEIFYKMDPETEIPRLLESSSHAAFAVLLHGSPVALTGIDCHGLMWALFSKDLPRNFAKFARASSRLMSFYHTYHDYLHCVVWAENAMICQWLGWLGFTATDTGKTEFGHDVIEFVHCNYGQDGSIYGASRPAMH